MSNVLTQSPLIIDTAAVTILKTGPICIDVIRWVGATTAAHTAVVQDAAGNVIWASHAPTTNHTEESVLEKWFNGLAAPTLASGKLYIYYH